MDLRSRDEAPLMVDKDNIRTYQFSYNDKVKLVKASTYGEARRLFQARYGFWPDPETVDIKMLDK